MLVGKLSLTIALNTRMFAVFTTVACRRRLCVNVTPRLSRRRFTFKLSGNVTRLNLLILLPLCTSPLSVLFLLESVCVVGIVTRRLMNTRISLLCRLSRR